LLSGNDENVIMGNYVADFVKGKLSEERTRTWDPDFVLGLRLHRFIDSYTDTHPLVKDVRHRIALTHGKAASVAVDLFFDHFLARDFSRYSDEMLPGFCKKIYEVIGRNTILIPEDMKGMAQAMVDGRWLETYASEVGIANSINGLARRYPFMSILAGAENDLMVNFDFYEERFQQFFPELSKASDEFLKSTK
jgi:acyl carrier protein phosphodiesterase